MIIVAIDTGVVESTFVVYDSEKKTVLHHDTLANMDLLTLLRGYNVRGAHLAIEMFQSYGNVTGQDTLDSCMMVGRFIEAWEGAGGKSSQIFRKEVLANVCHNTKAKKSHVRQAVIDHFGGDLVAVGGKKCPRCKGKGWTGRDHDKCDDCRGSGWEYPPGPLFKVKNYHKFDALALALTFCAAHEGMINVRRP